jgi:hypothetical protein
MSDPVTQKQGGHAWSLFLESQISFLSLKSQLLESRISISSVSSLDCPVWKRLAVHRPDFSIFESQISDLETSHEAPSLIFEADSLPAAPRQQR